uniref:WH2 domain-containing protein n=1 Tax=Panagrolaimus sp. ES5 TaxID=591445 RepID=A0AC34FKK2_9BILA
MKSLTKDKAATTTSGKPKKKRPSIFSFFSRKKTKTEPKSHSTLDDNISHGGSELNFDEVVVPKESAVIIPTAVKSKKTFRAPLPPPEENKENVKDISKKRLSNASVPPKFSRQGSRRSSRKSSSRRKAASNSKTAIKIEETKSVISNDSAPNDPPPPIPFPPPLETSIDNDEPSFLPSPPTMTHSNSNRLKTVIKTETIYTLKKAVEITPSLLETDVDKSLFKEKKQQSPVSVKKEKSVPKHKAKNDDEITTDMIFTSLPLPQPPSPPLLKPSSSSPKQTKPKKQQQKEIEKEREEDREIPPAIPQSAPPDPGAVATALSFKSTKQSSTASSVKRLVPPIPVSPFEDLTDSSSDSGNSTNITMPVYANGDLKHQLHIEHKKLLTLYEEWEMLRRPQNSIPNDGHVYANIMIKQEAVLRQHAIVTALYNQLLAPVVSNNSSPASTLRLKPAPPRHIINPTNSNPPTLSRGYMPSLYKSYSTYDVMNGENNNIKKEPERNNHQQEAGNYSPRISQTKRYSAGDVLNPIRPRLGSTETSENSNPHRYDERKKYVVEQKPVVRNVPIMTSLPKLTSVNIITEPKRNMPQTRNNFASYSPPVTKRELTPVNEKPIKQVVEAKKENVEIKKPPPLLNNVAPKTPSPLAESKVMKYPSPPNYSPRLNNRNQQHYYANSPPTTKRQIITNGFHQTNHSPPIRQISLPEVIQKKAAAKPPTPIQTKKVIITSKSSPTKSQPPANNGVHGDLMTSISAFPNVTLRSVPKPVEKSFNLGRVLENGERPSSYYREQEEEPIIPKNQQMSNGNGPPAPPPPPPPPSTNLFKKSNIKQSSPSSSSNVDADTIRGDMLAEIRKAGGVQFLRSISTK